MSETINKLSETSASLVRIQTFDATTLGRKEELGALNFEEAIAPARQLIELFQKIPIDMLKELPDGQLDEIHNPANSTYNLFQQILTFQLAQANPGDARTQLVQQMKGRYAPTFAKLYSWISYGVARTVDFNSLAAEGRAAIQAIEDRGEQMESRLGGYEKTAQNLEEKLRAALSEQGVGTQAHYFANEAEDHSKAAEKWGKATWWWSIAVGVAGIFSLFSHRIPFIAPENVPEAIQVVAAKVLLFGALTFMLVRSSRNYLAHKHNEVVNRHKENSLLTFNALVEAGTTPETRNIVLNHAAASIYSQPDSGYVKGRSEGGTSNTALIEMLPRLGGRTVDSSGA